MGVEGYAVPYQRSTDILFGHKHVWIGSQNDGNIWWKKESCPVLRFHLFEWNFGLKFWVLTTIKSLYRQKYSLVLNLVIFK